MQAFGPELGMYLKTLSLMRLQKSRRNSFNKEIGKEREKQDGY